jgi:hypothetical protein
MSQDAPGSQAPDVKQEGDNGTINVKVRVFFGLKG